MSYHRVEYRRSAFTLVEILVVLGIMCVLTILALAAVGKARAQSQQVACAAILKAWVQAFHSYAAQYDGYLPHSGDETRNPFAFLNMYDPSHPQNECCYLDVLPPLMGRPAWKSFALRGKPTADIWQCPLAVPFPDGAYAYSASTYGYHSLAMNHFLDFDIRTATRPMYPSFLNMSKAKTPTVTLLMLDATLNPNNANGQGGIAGACYLGYYSDVGPESLGDRHPHVNGKLGGNILMLDGHVEWTDNVWDTTLPHPETPPITNQMWWPY